MKKILKGMFAAAKSLALPIKRRFYILEHASPTKDGPPIPGVDRVRVVAPARRVQIADPVKDPFVRLGKHYREGYYDQWDVSVSDVPRAHLHVGSGLVTTHDFCALVTQPKHIFNFPQFGRPRPRKVEKLRGLYSTIHYCFSWNYYSWLVDGLARLESLALAEPTRPVTLIMPESSTAIHRESLEAVLPGNFTVKYYPNDTWLQLEHFLWPSHVAHHASAILPPGYYERIRHAVFTHYGLPVRHQPKRRLYITRRTARNRRAVNEADVLAVLEPYGFEVVELEKLNFREQVTLFHEAEVVTGPFGAGFHLIAFSGQIDVLTLHPEKNPLNYYHTMASTLGQRYHFLPGPSDDGEVDVQVDIPALREMLSGELALKPR